MKCEYAMFWLQLEKLLQNFSSLNLANSKWRQLMESAVVCEQGETAMNSLCTHTHRRQS